MRGILRQSFGLCISLVAMTATLMAGPASKAPAVTGSPLPTDWSHQHVIFSHPRTPEQAARVSKDIRYTLQQRRLNAKRSVEVPIDEETPDRIAVQTSPCSPPRPQNASRLVGGFGAECHFGGSAIPGKIVFQQHDRRVSGCGRSRILSSMEPMYLALAHRPASLPLQICMRGAVGRCPASIGDTTPAAQSLLRQFSHWMARRWLLLKHRE